jgi:hypothetical protein
LCSCGHTAFLILEGKADHLPASSAETCCLLYASLSWCLDRGVALHDIFLILYWELRVMSGPDEASCCCCCCCCCVHSFDVLTSDFVRTSRMARCPSAPQSALQFVSRVAVFPVAKATRPWPQTAAALLFRGACCLHRQGDV